MWNSWECEEWQVCGIRAIESKKIGGGHLWWWEGSSPDLDSWHEYCILNNGAPGAFSNIARPRNTSPWRDRVCPNALYSGCRSRWELSSRGFFERCQAQIHITPAGSSVPQHHLLWLSVTMRAKLQGLFERCQAQKPSSWRGRVWPNAPYSGCRSRWEPSSGRAGSVPNRPHLSGRRGIRVTSGGIEAPGSLQREAWPTRTRKRTRPFWRRPWMNFGPKKWLSMSYGLRS